MFISGAGLTTQGLYHYPATITNPKIAWEFAQFAPSTVASDNVTTTTTAGVINVIDGRQQVCPLQASIKNNKSDNT